MRNVYFDDGIYTGENMAVYCEKQLIALLPLCQDTPIPPVGAVLAFRAKSTGKLEFYRIINVPHPKIVWVEFTTATESQQALFEEFI